MFFLGTHMVNWLGQTAVPLFISAVRLRRRKALPVASGPWALDSGGYSALSVGGEYPVSAMAYAEEARRWSRAIGGMTWAAVQDWMCEPHVIAKTGLSVLEHQRRTVHSLLLLRQLAPGVSWTPVIQGYTLAEYLRCVEMHGEAGFDLRREPVVGLGSICRRQDTAEAEEVIHALHGMGLRIHGFGLKLGGLRRVGHLLASADSMAWSFSARKQARDGVPPVPPCTHPACSSCLLFALRWREKALAAWDAAGQGWLKFPAKEGVAG